MIEFVDLKNGNLFHINSGDPYTFWFENGQSINLNYVKKICFISDRAKAHIQCNSPVFSILKLDQNIPIFNETHGELINAKRYIDLVELKTNDCHLIGYTFTPVGFTTPVYVYMLYIMGCSKDSGEIRDKFYIDGNEYEVGADFYTPNEVLKSNLENFDITIPEAIQKAIFDVNVHEESNDNITLNRKYKELLMNYWSIVANKGSYNSLLNSLAWFEWGDLVRIEEVWKRHGRHMEDYFHEELNRSLNDEFVAQLANNEKTTYIGLYMALSKLTQDKNGNIEYVDAIGGSSPITGYGTSTALHNLFERDEDALNTMGWDSSGMLPVGGGRNELEPARVTEHLAGTGGEIPRDSSRDVMVYNEPNPQLKLVATKWNLLELCLKMTLLGNFYSTYFMPIHMDLIHSTVEHWVFAYALKMLNTTGVYDVRTKSNGNSFSLICDKEAKIKHVLNHVYSNTLFKSNGDVFGFNKDVKPYEQKNGQFNPLMYFYGGSAGVINFQASIPAIDQNDIIYKQRLSWFSDTGVIGTLTDTISGDVERFDRWFNVTLSPTLWFVQDKYADPKPGKFICRKPGQFERSVLPDPPVAYEHPGHHSGEEHPCHVEPGVYMYPVTQSTLNDHDWIRLGLDSNQLWPIDPNQPNPYPDVWEEANVVELPDENFTSYPNNDTYEYRWMHNFEFSLGFRKAGHYHVTLEFWLSSGQSYTRSAEFDIIDNVTNHIDIWQVIPKDINQRTSLKPQGIEALLNSFQMSNRLDEEPVLDREVQRIGGINYEYDIYRPYQEHSIFIQRSESSPLLLNHTVILDIPSNEQVILGYKDENEEDIEVLIYPESIEQLQTHFPNYLWITNMVNNKLRCIGITRKFQTEEGNGPIIDRITPANPNSPRWRMIMNPVSGEYESVKEWRFQPFMFRLKKFENWTPENGVNAIKTTDLIYAEPVLKFSLDQETSNWKFKNMSTGEEYESDLFDNNQYTPVGNYGYRRSREPHPGGMQSSFVIPYNETHLNPGYYTIELHYTKGGEHQVCKYDSAFLMSR